MAEGLISHISTIASGVDFHKLSDIHNKQFHRMTVEKVRLFCILDGDTTAFSVKVESDDTVDELKKAIKSENPNLLCDIDARELVLWHVSIPPLPKKQISLDNLIVSETLKKPVELDDPTSEISEVFGTAPPKRTIHIIVQWFSGGMANKFPSIHNTPPQKTTGNALAGNASDSSRLRRYPGKGINHGGNFTAIVNKPSLPVRQVFGVALDMAVNQAQVHPGYKLPAVVYRCIEYLNAHNAKMEIGIYRQSGSLAVISELKDRFNREGDVLLLSNNEYFDIHAVAGLLKLFFRELPSPVLTKELQDDFKRMSELPNRAKRVDEVTRLIAALPEANYILLRALVAHLIEIIENADVNKMTEQSVYIVLAPTLGFGAEPACRKGLIEQRMETCDTHMDEDEESTSFLNWPRLSSSSYSPSRPAPRWVSVLGPSQVLVFPNFLSVQDTNALIEYIQQEMKAQIDDKIDPTKPRPRPVPRPGYAFRDNDRIQFQSEEFASMLWNKCGFRDRWTELWQHPKWGLESVQGESITSGTRNNKRVRHAVGLSRNIRFYRYQKGQSFGAHYDESVIDTTEEGETISEYTVLIYLNGERDSDLLGGETVFYPKGKKTAPAASNGSSTGKQTKKGAKASKTSIEPITSDSNSSSTSLSYMLPNGGVAVKPERGLLLVHKHGDEFVVCGAAGGIGQPLSLLLKQSDLITHLALYDVVNAPGVAADLSHINTRSKVTGHGKEGMDEALKDAHTVVIPAGVPRKPGMTRDDLFKINAGIIRDLAEGVVKNCPNAHVLVISNPVNSTVPIVCEVLKKHGVFNPKKVFGISTLDVVRSSRFAYEFSNAIDPQATRVTVIGGHSGVTIVPILSKIPGQSFTKEQLDALTHRIQFGGDEVVKAKDGAGSATLSMAYAGARFTNAVLRATVAGETGIIESTYVNLLADPEHTADFRAKTQLEYFAQDVEFGREGVSKILELPTLSAYEQGLLDIAVPELKVNISKGVAFVNDSSKI
ncbi:hypothetical protein BGZ80_004284 [Entomortierella chlamydospora]|uniref:malate dehydrogenase n=1 Tax=Entomortierella chlamydospora TaxID=101097 RepID=A0A9P6N3Z8_9FUNG|nr:hypothetical protein BGZ80_004284 [Entomortierella chlamydospora]